jgi:ABC-type ATPase involved in cell division
MNFSIKGRLYQTPTDWVIDIPIIAYSIHKERPLLCLQELERQLKEDLKDESLQCFFKIDDSGILYLITAQTSELIDLIAERKMNLDDVKLVPGLDD